MSLLQTIRADLDAARREKNQRLLTILTTLYSEAAMVGKTKRNDESTNEEVISVTRKFKIGVEEVQKIRGTTDISDFELVVYNKYLPKSLTTEELSSIINSIVSSLEERTPKQMGLVMNKLKTDYLGRYDGNLASQLTKECLTLGV